MVKKIGSDPILTHFPLISKKAKVRLNNEKRHRVSSAAIHHGLHKNLLAADDQYRPPFRRRGDAGWPLAAPDIVRKTSRATFAASRIKTEWTIIRRDVTPITTNLALKNPYKSFPAVSLR